MMELEIMEMEELDTCVKATIKMWDKTHEFTEKFSFSYKYMENETWKQIVKAYFDDKITLSKKAKEEIKKLKGKKFKVE